MKRKLSVILAFFFIGLSFVFSQTQINGLVVDETGEPIIGATIQVKSTPNIGTVTNFDGAFSINTAAGSKLTISYVGMRTLEVNASANMRVVMHSDSELLDELMVIAYGTARKSSITGAISTVDVADIEKRPVSSVSSVLEGSGTGIQVNSTYGQPGEDARYALEVLDLLQDQTHLYMFWMAYPLVVMYQI